MKETFPSWRPPAHQLGLSGPLITGDSVQSSLTPLEHPSTNHSIAPPTRIPDQNPANICLWDFRQNPDLGSNSMSKGAPWIFTQHVYGSSIKHTVRILSLSVPGGLKGTGNTLSAQKAVLDPLSCYSRMPLTILLKAAQRHWYSTYHVQVGTHSFLLYNTPGFIFYVFDSFRFILCIRHLFFFSKWVLGWYSYWLFPHFQIHKKT